MQSSSSLPPLPFRKKLRRGQERVLQSLNGKKLNVKLPTGYGKTLTFLAAYSVLKRQGRTNRLLVIFPTLNQLEQFKRDGPVDIQDACIDGPRCVMDVRYFGKNAIKAHKLNTCQVFVTTIQSLMHASASNVVGELLTSGRWMVVIDEHHHYGIDQQLEKASWGRRVSDLPCEFLMALSATPNRPGDDGVFGPPDINVTYRQAAQECAVKPLCGHSYIYRIDAVMENGEIRPFTTSELVAEVGSDSPENIEKYLVKSKMRWSPKYISPLVTVPVERMLRDRIRTGHQLQALIGAMCVSHAKLACEQIRAMYPELRIDWVGTGPNGRTDAENQKVRDSFCPPKDPEGRRAKPSLDIVVHVGMLGEGMDLVLVSEIIYLRNAALNNRDAQFDGRSARYLEGVEGNISFDSSTPRAREGYKGPAIMDAMDGLPPSPDDAEPDDEGDGGDPRSLSPLPDEPRIQIWDMELDRIDSGDPEVQRYKQWVCESGLTPFTPADLGNPQSDIHQLALAGYRNMRRVEAEQHNREAITQQWRNSVDSALSAVAGLVSRVMCPKTQRIEKSLLGDIKRRINSRKKRLFGEVTADEEVCRRHYHWLVQLEREIRNTGRVPEWLV